MNDFYYVSLVSFSPYINSSVWYEYGVNEVRDGLSEIGKFICNDYTLPINGEKAIKGMLLQSIVYSSLNDNYAKFGEGALKSLEYCINNGQDKFVNTLFYWAVELLVKIDIKYAKTKKSFNRILDFYFDQFRNGSDFTDFLSDNIKTCSFLSLLNYTIQTVPIQKTMTAIKSFVSKNNPIVLAKLNSDIVIINS